MATPRQDDNYRGYCEDMPYKKGDVVVFSKGARLFSRNPKKKGHYEAKRAQTVTVDHVLCGRSILLGVRYKKYPEVVYWQQRHKDVIGYAKRLGMGHPWQDAEATFQFLLRHTEARDDGNRVEHWLHLSNPAVCWPGSGGYWVECDVNDIEGQMEVPE